MKTQFLIIGILAITSSVFANQQTVPSAIARNEILSSVYRDYTSPGSTKSPNLYDLRLGDEEGFQCELYSFENGELSEKIVSFQSLQTGGGRFVRIRLQSELDDSQTTFLLKNGGHPVSMGWRGQSDRVRNQIDFSKNILRLGEREYYGDDGVRGKFSEYYNRRHDISTTAMHLRDFPTICVRANSLNPHELFIELGSKTNALFYNYEGKPILDLTDRKVFMTMDNIVTRATARVSLSLLALESYFSKRLLGNRSRPKSFCFSDLENSKLSNNVYKMEGIGICTRTK